MCTMSFIDTMYPWKYIVYKGMICLTYSNTGHVWEWGDSESVQCRGLTLSLCQDTCPIIVIVTN